MAAPSLYPYQGLTGLDLLAGIFGNLPPYSIVVTDNAGNATGINLTNGQVLIGFTGAPPVANTLTAGADISITNGPGTITIASSSGGNHFPVPPGWFFCNAAFTVNYAQCYCDAGIGGLHYQDLVNAVPIIDINDTHTCIGADAGPLLVAASTQFATCIGAGAGFSLPSAPANPAYCVFIGNNAGQDKTTSGAPFDGDIAIGYAALVSLSTGFGNTCIGFGAGLFGTPITTGSWNILLGWEAGVNSAAAINRIVIGNSVSNTVNNSFVIGNAATTTAILNASTLTVMTGAAAMVGSYSSDGVWAEYNSGYHLAAVTAGTTTVTNYFSMTCATAGGIHMQDLVLGNPLMDIGYAAGAGHVCLGTNAGALLVVTSTQFATCIGAGAGFSLPNIPANDSYATFIGGLSGTSKTTSGAAQDGDTGCGYGTLFALSTGYGNTATGFRTAVAITTGFNNTCEGYQAGQTIVGGSENICIGYQADVTAGAAINRITIGYNISNATDNSILLGNAATTTAIFNISTLATFTGAVTIQGVLTNSHLGLGIVHSSAGGVFTSSAVNLASGDVTGVLPVANLGISAGTNITISGAGVISATTDGTDNQFPVPPGWYFCNAALSVNYFQMYCAASGGVHMQDIVLGFPIMDITGTAGSLCHTCVGHNAGANLVAASTNNATCFGFDAGGNLPSAPANRAFVTFIGQQAGVAKTTSGNANDGDTAVGFQSLVNLSTGAKNTALGFQAGGTITTGSLNICIGYQADVSAVAAINRTTIAYNMQNGTDNSILIGNLAMTQTTINTGTNLLLYDGVNSRNIGLVTGFSTTLGVAAGINFTMTSTNVATLVGHSAGQKLPASPANAAYSVFVGDFAGSVKTTSGNANDGDVGIGYAALEALSTGYNNTCEGWQSGVGITTGFQNTFFGYYTGPSCTTGSLNVCIGFQANVGNTAAVNRIALGANVTNNIDNSMILGNTSITTGTMNCTGLFTFTGSAPAFVTTVTTSNVSTTITAAQFLGGILVTTGLALTFTTDTGTAIYTAMGSPAVGTTITCFLASTSASTLTWAAGVGVTLVQNVSATAKAVNTIVYLRVTGVNTITMYC